MQEKVDIQQTKPAAPSEPSHSTAAERSPHTLSELLRSPPPLLQESLPSPHLLLPGSVTVDSNVLAYSGRGFVLRGGGGAGILPHLHSKISLLTGAAERMKFR